MPGEYEELEITLRWKKQEDNFGEKINIASISKTNNPANFEETSKEDNKSQATMLITIGTGLEKINMTTWLYIIGWIVIIGLSGYNLGRKMEIQLKKEKASK